MDHFNKMKSHTDKDNTQIKIVATLEKKIDGIMQQASSFAHYDHPVITDEEPNLEDKIAGYQTPMDIWRQREAEHEAKREEHHLKQVYKKRI